MNEIRPIEAEAAEAESGGHPIYANAPHSGEFNKLRKRLIRLTREALDRFEMVRPGEKWLVALSGGKDSYSMLALLLDLKWRGLLPVELLVCNLDQGQPNFPKHILPAFLEGIGVPHRIEYKDTYSIVTSKLPAGATYCSLCSRLRRGNLYRIAREEGCTALVLGHHRDDSLETFFMNLFHGGKLAAMPQRFSDAMAFPIIPCDLCGSQDGLERNAMKAMLGDIEKRMPGRKDVMIRALGNINASHMLDTKLFDFSALFDKRTQS